MKEFQIHQNLAEPRKYFFYEVFAGEAAFADHQQTPHFKNIIVGQADSKACEPRARRSSASSDVRPDGARLASFSGTPLQEILWAAGCPPARPAATSKAARASSNRPSLCKRSPRTLPRR